MTEEISSSVEFSAADAKRVLIPLDILFVLSILSLQAFGYIFQQIGADLGAVAEAPLITSIPSIVLGIVCFIYGSLSDYVSLKKMTIAGMALFFAGSVLGFFLHGNIWLVIFARCLQTAGGQVAGSIYLAITSRYLKGAEQVTFFGIFTASYQLSTAIGVVSSGLLSAVDWSLLFLVPLVGVLAVPTLLRGMPETDAGETKVDVAGFVIFGVMITLLTLYFSFGWMYLVGAAVALAVFVAYIHRAAEPFITPAFFRNARWLRAIALMVVFYFVNYSVTSLFNGACATVYGLSSSESSLYLVAGNIASCVVACCSGKVVSRIGRDASIFVSGAAQVAGFTLAALCIAAGVVPFAFGICLYFAGVGLLFSPLSTTILGTLSADEVGRGIGMNDLAMNVSASIGIAIFGSIMGTTKLSDASVIGLAAETATYSNLLFIYAGIMLLGVLAFAAFRKRIAAAA